MRLIRKFIAVVLVLAMVVTLIPTTALANDTITVTIDGQRVTLADQQPVIINNRTLVPVGGVFEHLGFTPSWSGSAQTATLTRADYTVVITIGSATFTTNDIAHTLDVPAQIINNRTMLPLRAVLESIGIAPDNIGWDGNARAITIITGADVTPPWWSVDDLDPALSDFISGMDMDSIREALGVDFTIDMTEHIGYGDTPYRFLDIGDHVFEIGDLTWGAWAQVITFNTQTGDIVLARGIDLRFPGENVLGNYIVLVDIGAYLDVYADVGSEFPDWATDANRVYYIILLTFVTCCCNP